MMLKEILMIARIWHGITDISKADEYLAYINKTGVVGYRSTQGNLGVFVMCKFEGNETHFMLFTLWESEDTINRFTGQDIELRSGQKFGHQKQTKSLKGDKLGFLRPSLSTERLHGQVYQQSRIYDRVI